MFVLDDEPIDLGERRVSVRDPSQGDHEFQEIRVRLLPERFLGFAEQIVQQTADGIRDGVRIQIVVQRVVADAGVEANFEVVRLTIRGLQDLSYLPTEVAFHFQHQAT